MKLIPRKNRSLNKAFNRISKKISKKERKHLKELILIAGASWLIAIGTRNLILRLLTYIGLIADPNTIGGDVITVLIAVIYLLFIYYFFEFD